MRATAGWCACPEEAPRLLFHNRRLAASPARGRRGFAPGSPSSKAGPASRRLSSFLLICTLAAAPATTGASSSPRDPAPLANTESALAALVARLTPPARQALGGTLRPDGHELAAVLLRPLAEGRGPLPPEQMDAAAKRAAADPRNLESLLRHRVSLLGGLAPQDLGDPIDWFRAPNGDRQWTTHLSCHYWIKPLAHAWRATKDPRYSRDVLTVLVDWVRRMPLGSPDLQWSAPRSLGEGIPATAQGLLPNYGNGPWSSLSAEARVKHWTELLAFLWDAPGMTNATVAILLNSLLGDHRLMLLNHERLGTANQFLAVADALIHLAWWYPDFTDTAPAEKVAGSAWSVSRAPKSTPTGPCPNAPPTTPPAACASSFPCCRAHVGASGRSPHCWRSACASG